MAHIVKCPSCDNESMTLSQSQYAVDNFGTVLMSVATCQACGYKHTDVLTMNAKEPVAMSAKIDSVDDLSIRVIKSGTATVAIPEFGATITPGPYSEGYISNVEGVLEKVEDALMFMLGSASGKRLKKGERILAKIRSAKERGPHFTIMIKDPFGNSALVSTKAGKIKKRRLTRRELEHIGFGRQALQLMPKVQGLPRPDVT